MFACEETTRQQATKLPQVVVQRISCLSCFVLLHLLSSISLTSTSDMDVITGPIGTSPAGSGGPRAGAPQSTCLQMSNVCKHRASINNASFFISLGSFRVSAPVSFAQVCGFCLIFSFSAFRFQNQGQMES